MPTKEQYVQAFKKELKERNGRMQPVDLTDIEVRTVWMNPKGGLRLTSFGFDLITDLDIESWRFERSDEERLSAGNLLMMDRYLECPYFLRRNDIFVFGAKIATAIAIVGSPIRFVNVRAKTQAKNI